MQSRLTRRISVPIAADPERYRSYVGKQIAHERLLQHAMAEIKRQLFATTPQFAKDKETGQWVQIGDKPDNRARQWAVDRILDLAGAYPPKGNPSDQERDLARARTRALVEQYKGEPVAVLKFCYDTGRWPTDEERATLLATP